MTDRKTKPAWEKGTGIVNIDSEVGEGTVVWNFVVLFKCRIGKDCIIGSFTEVGGEVGDKCKIEAGVFIPRGVIIEDEVFIGPHVVFTNDRFPRANVKSWQVEETVVKKGASIGANATIRCGIIIGENAMVGCGAVVTSDVGEDEVFYGEAARYRGKHKKP